MDRINITIFNIFSSQSATYTLILIAVIFFAYFMRKKDTKEEGKKEETNMVIYKLMGMLRENEKYLMKKDWFEFKENFEKNLWTITTYESRSNPVYIIQQTGNTFTMNKKYSYFVRSYFGDISADRMLNGVFFYLIGVWCNYQVLGKYTKVTNDMTLEEATKSLQNNLAGFKYAYFNTSKGVKLKQVNDKTYAFEVKINGKKQVETDTLELIAQVVFLLSLKIHYFYIMFHEMKMRKVYEEECKKLFLFDELYDFSMVSFLRLQRGGYR